MIIRHKSLDVGVCEPSIALHTPEFKAACPPGKAPIAGLMDGSAIVDNAYKAAVETFKSER